MSPKMALAIAGGVFGFVISILPGTCCAVHERAYAHACRAWLHAQAIYKMLASYS